MPAAARGRGDAADRLSEEAAADDARGGTRTRGRRLAGGGGQRSRALVETRRSECPYPVVHTPPVTLTLPRPCLEFQG